MKAALMNRVVIGGLVIFLLVTSTVWPGIAEYATAKIRFMIGHRSNETKETSGREPIQFEQQVGDLGKISVNSEAGEFEYRFFNEANKRFRLTQVLITCGCTTAEFENNWVEPRAWSSLKLRYAPGLKPHLRGRFYETVVARFEGEDEGRHDIKVSIMGETVDDLVVEPELVSFKDFYGPGGVEQIVQVTNSFDETLTIGIQSDDPGAIRIEPERMELKPGESGEMRLAIQVTDVRSSLSGHVTLSTETSNGRRISRPVPVRGRPRRSPVFVDVAEVVFGFCKRSDEPSKPLILKSLDQGFKILKVSSDKLPVTASFDEGVEASHSLKLTPVLSGIEEKGMVKGVVTVAFEYDGLKQELEVPTSVFVVDSKGY